MALNNKLLVITLMLYMICVLPACTTTYTPIQKYDENIRGKPRQIQDLIQTGEVVRVITHTDITSNIILERIEDEELLVGRDLLTEQIIKIPLTDIKKILVTRTIVGEQEERTVGPTEVMHGAVVIPLWILGDALQRHDIESATAFYPGGSIRLDMDDRRKDARNYYNDEATKRHKNKTPFQAHQSFGKPTNKYFCHDGGGTIAYAVWEYIFPYRSKILYFNPITGRLDYVKDILPSGCCALVKDIGHESSLDEICKAQERRKDIDIKLGVLEYATYAVSRNGDMDRTYRLLEQGIVSEFGEVRDTVRQFIKENPVILDGARHSFTKESLEESIAKYGDRAKKIESDRLDVYKIISSSDDYFQARKNYESVFGN
jgi:hypothetical protein